MFSVWQWQLLEHSCHTSFSVSAQWVLPWYMLISRAEILEATESAYYNLIPPLSLGPEASLGLHLQHLSPLFILPFSPVLPDSPTFRCVRLGLFCWTIAAQFVVSRGKIKGTPYIALLLRLLGSFSKLPVLFLNGVLFFHVYFFFYVFNQFYHTY